MPLPLTVSCFSKIQIGFTFLVPADLGSPRKRPLNGCVWYSLILVYWSIGPLDWQYHSMHASSQPHLNIMSWGTSDM